MLLTRPAEQMPLFLIPCWLHGLGRLAHDVVLAAEMDHLIGTLKDGGLCKDVHYKELYIPQAELEGVCAYNTVLLQVCCVHLHCVQTFVQCQNCLLFGHFVHPCAALFASCTFVCGPLPSKSTNWGSLDFIGLYLTQLLTRKPCCLVQS